MTKLGYRQTPEHVAKRIAAWQQPTETYFWSHVNKRGPRAGRLGRCWVWTGATQRKGYGHLGHDGHDETAHRYAWELANGPVPAGRWVLHHCDNPPCVRLSHLFLGTSVENQQDSVAKGRHHNARKTHCPAKHPYSGDNLYIESSGRRRCRTCRRKSGAKA